MSTAARWLSSLMIKTESWRQDRCPFVQCSENSSFAQNSIPKTSKFIWYIELSQRFNQNITKSRLSTAVRRNLNQVWDIAQTLRLQFFKDQSYDLHGNWGHANRYHQKQQRLSNKILRHLTPSITNKAVFTCVHSRHRHTSSAHVIRFHHPHGCSHV